MVTGLYVRPPGELIKLDHARTRACSVYLLPVVMQYGTLLLVMLPPRVHARQPPLTRALCVRPMQEGLSCTQTCLICVYIFTLTCTLDTLFSRRVRTRARMREQSLK